jgi:hypothetical protein
MAKKEKKNPGKDAQILLHLYELRREPTMRKARSFMTGEFWPQSYDEFKTVLFDFGSERNAWARQALTFWDMAAAIVLSGAVDEDLFYETNGELYFLYAKFKNFLPQFRKEFIDPEFATRIEKLATKSIKGRNRVKRMEAYFKARAAQQAAAAKDGN